MINKLFPTLVVDSFLEDPDKLVEYSKTLEYFYDDNYQWPGKRTRPLHEINKSLFLYLGNKILNVYNLDIPSTWNASAHFQIVDKNYSEGWVHCDPTTLTAILYLNKKQCLKSGTSLYNTKEIYSFPIHSDKKKEIFRKISLNSNYNMSKEDLFYLKENNEQFEETLTIKNFYNRLFLFEGSTFHSANDFDNEEPRLTLIFFFHEINVKENKYPLSEKNKINISI